MKKWLYLHFPIVTTRLKRYLYTDRIVNDEVAQNSKAYDNFIKFKDKCTWAAINPVVHSLEELRNNTWDKERVDHAIKWLRDNFEVRNDNT